MSDQETELGAWVSELADALGLDGATDVDALLNLAGTVARAVIRPAAPLTTYLAGVAVGSGMDLGDVIATVEHTLTRRGT